MTRSLDYGQLMHRAMQGLIISVLRDVQANGLPGAHHFYITFDTRHPRVHMADWLRERFPEDITIVVQHWFRDLEVDDEGFAITLNFGDVPEPLYVPFDALRTFVDPSVEFGLRFEEQNDPEDEANEDEDEGPEDDPIPPGGAEVVRLDRFRK